MPLRFVLGASAPAHHAGSKPMPLPRAAPISIEHPGRLLDLSAAIDAGKESTAK
jgi:hypothetical protein